MPKVYITAKSIDPQTIVGAEIQVETGHTRLRMQVEAVTISAAIERERAGMALLDVTMLEPVPGE